MDAKQYQLRKIAASGLTVAHEAPPVDIPTVLDVWKTVASMQTQPMETVSLHEADALAEVDRAWMEQATAHGIFDKFGIFLIHVAGVGSTSCGWTRVRWSDNATLAATLQDDSSPEFVAMALDGHSFCAVTTEEYAYWIIARHFA